MKAVLTVPAEAEEFAERTGVDALAVAVGTVHRMHDQAAEVRFELIEEIQKRVSIPLVMHGATGIPDNDLRKLTKTGFGKVNIGTALRMAFGNTMRREFAENPRTFDRLELLQKPMNAVKQEVMHKMKLLNTDQYNKLPN
jgi:fructose-bisphosphate aldolase class II